MVTSAANRAEIWRLRTRTLALPRLPRLMGIVNVTPDSFSDGGRYFGADTAVGHALQLVAEGADILDVGGESTRPGAVDVAESAELERVIPVIRRLVESADVPVSIDTRKAAVAEAALDAGAEIINDVSGLTADPRMVSVAAESGAGLCVMHMQGTPQTMQMNPQYDDIVREVRDYLAARRDALVAAGVDPARICLDPGIGFGKTYAHNLALLENCHTLHELGCPLLVGHSRKRFLGTMIGDEYADRTQATVNVALDVAKQGVQVLRVHDVGPVREALLALATAGGLA